VIFSAHAKIVQAMFRLVRSAIQHTIINGQTCWRESIRIFIYDHTKL